jgi:hypothetical protein
MVGVGGRPVLSLEVRGHPVSVILIPAGGDGARP